MTARPFEPARLVPGTAANDAAGPGTGVCTAVDDGKTFATLQARAALAGWLLSQDRGADGAVVYLASRWGRAQELASLAAVVELLRRVGAGA